MPVFVLVKASVIVAVRMLSTLEQLKVDSAPKAESIPAHVRLAQRAYVLQAAAMALVNGTILPDGFDADELDRDAVLASYAELVNGDKTDEDLTASAHKLAAAKITRSVDRHDVGAYIVRAFGDTPEVGTVLTIAQVRRDGALDGYQASPGAIRARMEGSGVEGFELVERTTDTPYSIRYTGTE